MKLLVVLERGSASFGACVPDLPGCVAAAPSRAEAVELIRDAMALQLEDLKTQGGKIPVSLSESELIEVHA